MNYRNSLIILIRFSNSPSIQPNDFFFSSQLHKRKDLFNYQKKKKQQEQKKMFTIPLLCLILYPCIIYTPSTLKVTYFKITQKPYDNVNPRDYNESLDGWGKRALAAHQNSLEIYPFFVAGVLAAHVETEYRDINNNNDNDDYKYAAAGLSIAFLVLRILYVAVYIGGVNTVVASIRSVVWILSALCCMGLVIVALAV
eukprot:gb/GECH01009207.1/.p1 GENE.gb/GECH01009207.1/~~gb/GECH01009207.1/.p1  ORF type:complete len:198 (+),score=20.35 gb/GECH01009207.1/:1-594(+)